LRFWKSLLDRGLAALAAEAAGLAALAGSSPVATVRESASVRPRAPHRAVFRLKSGMPNFSLGWGWGGVLRETGQPVIPDEV
jgi:hypothetical protein